MTLSYSDVTFDTTPNALCPGNVFFFQVDNGTGLWFTSHYFNITNSSTSTSTTSTTATSSASLQTTSVAAPPSASATATPSATPMNTPSGLDTGQKAGIGVGVALGAILVVAGLVWFLRFRKSEKASGAELEHMYPPENTDLGYDKAGNPYQGRQVAELTGERLSEVPGHLQRQELAGQDPRQELL